MNIQPQQAVQQTARAHKRAVESTKRAYHDLQDYARAHGISAEPFIQSGWTFTRYQNRPALRFATHTGDRFRFLDGQKPVYINPRGYKRCWYLLENAVQTALTRQQTLILCNGEASTVTAQAHGLPATAITGGEKNRLPDDLLAQLIKAYPPAPTQRIFVVLDCDTAGRTASAGITAQLRAMGYSVDALDLQLSDGGDLADYCKLNAGDDLPTLLNHLPRLQIADLLPTKPNTARLDLPRFTLNTPPVNFSAKEKRPTHTESAQTRWQQVRDEVMQRLGVAHLRTNGDNWTIKRIPNPFVNHEHDHRAPACVFNTESGTLYDHKGGHTYTLRELANLLNVEYPDTIKERDTNPSARSARSLVIESHTSTLTAGDLAIFKQGLPDAWRAATAAYLPKPCVVLLEHLNRAFHTQDLNPAQISLPDVKALSAQQAWGLTRSTLERGFEGLIGVFFTELDPVNSQVVSQSVEKGGRPRLYYRLLDYKTVCDNVLAYAAPRIMEKYHPVDGDDAVLARLTGKMMEAIGVDMSTETLDKTLERAYQAQGERGVQAHQGAWRAYKNLTVSLHDHRSTPLPADVIFTNRRDYDALLTRAYAEINPQRSRRQIAHSIGVSLQQVSTVLKRAGIQNEAQYEAFAIQAGDNVRAQIHREVWDRKGFVREVIVTTADSVQYLTYNPERTPTLIEGILRAGAEVEVRVQIASKQRIVRERVLPEPVAKSVQKSPSQNASSTQVTPSKVPNAPVKPRKSAKNEPFTGKSFDPAWVRGQIWLALGLLGWCTYGDDALKNPHTGEIVTRDARDSQLAQALVGQRVALLDDLLNFARDELGAIV